MSQIYLTSDLHLGHIKEFMFKPRGFSCVEEHDRNIIANINKVVAEDDILYILGDLMLNDNDKGVEYLKQIKCQDVRVVLGNHDTDNRKVLYESLPNFTVLGYAHPFKYKKWHFMLSHYSMATANYDDDEKPYLKVHNICGHSHIKNRFDDKTGSYHVELDAHENFPVSIDEIISDIKNRKEIQKADATVPHECYTTHEHKPFHFDGNCPHCGQPLMINKLNLHDMEIRYDFDKGYSYRFNGHFVCENCGKEVDEFQTYWGELK